MAKRLFVGGLAWATTDASLQDFFSQAGTVTFAQVKTDKFTGKSRGFGFVEMSSDEEAERAVQELNGKELDGRSIVVNEARPQEQRDNNGPRNFSDRNDRGGSRGGYNNNRSGGNDRRNRY